MTIRPPRGRSWHEEKWSNREPTPGVVMIRDYFELQYRPDRLATAPRKYVLTYYSALSNLEMHLGNDPERLDIKAITPQSLEDFAEAAVKAGYKSSTVRMRLDLLFSIMRHACPHRFPGRKSREAVWAASANSPVEINAETLLVTYLRHVFFAQRSYSPHYKTAVWNAVFKISAAIGEPARLRHLNDREITATLHYMKNAGLSKATIQKQGDYIRTLWKHAVRKGLAAPGVLSRRPRRIPRYGSTDPVTGADGSLWWYCTKRYFPANLRIRAGHTKDQYHHAMRSFKRFLQHEPMPADLDDDTVIAWMGSLRDEGRLAAKTINERAGRIAALWKWLAKKRIVEQFPTFGRIKQPKRIPKAWKLEEIERIFAAARQVQGDYDGSPACDWWIALLSVLWDTAARIGEVMAVEWEWLDWNTGMLSVPAEVRKNGERDMVYQLGPDTRDALRRIYRESSTRVFRIPGDRYELWRKYKEILKAAGLPHDRYCGFHKIRRTVASYMQAAGHDACTLLRHSSPSVAIESYLDPSIVGTARPCDALPRPAVNPRKDETPC